MYKISYNKPYLREGAFGTSNGILRVLSLGPEELDSRQPKCRAWSLFLVVRQLLFDVYQDLKYKILRYAPGAQHTVSSLEDKINPIALCVVIWEQLAGLSESFCGVALESLRGALGLILKRLSKRFGILELLSVSGELQDEIPRTISQARANVYPDLLIKVYPTCSSCRALYYPRDIGTAASLSLSSSLLPELPETCTSRIVGEVICGQSLRRPLNFAVHPLMEWLVRSLSRPGFEKAVDDAWNPVTSPFASPVVDDFWSAASVRETSWPDGFPGKAPVGTPPMHLYFACFVDGFNPWGNKQAGKKASLTGIQLVCLNIPKTERYKRENILLAGVIPGPKEPNYDQIHQHMTPLIEEFEALWNGVFLTSTPLYPEGRGMYAAIAFFVCDLPACRKVGGFASHNSKHVCHICLKSRKNLHDISPSPFRDPDHHRREASKYKDAPNRNRREAIVDETGYRHSAALGLKYFDIRRHMVVDGPHVLELGLASRHFREIWGIQIVAERGTSKAEVQDGAKQRIILDNLCKILRSKRPSKTALNRCRVGYLKAIVKLNGVPVVAQEGQDPLKADYIRSLLQWVSIDLLSYRKLV